MSRKVDKLREKDFDLAVIAYTSPKSAMAEAYRVLRTNLGFAGMERPFRSVLVTSALAGEGKSTVASNLAVITAQAGHKVILVDCDLRKPCQHKIFHIPNNKGFTNCIVNNTDPEQVTEVSAVINLRVLTSGVIPPNPAEILNLERTRLFLKSLKSKYDYVFIDSPPILAVTDASILASQVDGTLLVVHSGETRIDVARQAQDQLTKANARIIGVVLNRVKNDTNDHYY